MTDPTLRDLRPGMDAALDTVTAFSLAAVRETCPEIAADPTLLPNFTFDAMRAMHLGALPKPEHRFLTAWSGEALVGHAVFSLKDDADTGPWGHVFTLYVVPAWRRRGLARRLLVEGEAWFRAHGRRVARAATHATNAPVLALTAELGWRRSGPFRGAWPYYALEKDLAPIAGADRAR